MEFIHREIKPPESLGEILQAARTKKDLTLEQAEEETKVRARYLEALENGHYELLPSSVYAVGFLAKYADFLGLNKDRLIEMFSHERGKGYNHAKIMVERRLKEPFFSITPRFMMITGIVLGLAAILGYIIFSVYQFTSPPNLEISSPSADQVIQEDSVKIIGKTDEGVTLMINGENVLMDDKGNFSQTVKLHPGLNSFEIRSINGLKKENVKLIKVLADIAGTQMPATVVQPSASPSASISVSPSVSPSISPKILISVSPTAKPSASPKVSSTVKNN